MRIATSQIFDAGVRSINRQWADLLHLQQQVASGRRVLRPSDDPVAAARALEVEQSADVLTQFATNQKNAESALALAEGQMITLSDLFGRLKELTVQAGNGTLTASDRRALATELRARYDELLGIANSADGQGLYLFSGYRATTRPFAGSVDEFILGTRTEIDYLGDDGQRRLQVSASRLLEVSDAGSDLFLRTGNGESVFKTLARLIGELEANDTSGIGVALERFDRAHDNVLRVRAAIGSRLNELASIGDINEDLQLQYQQTLSRLRDLDYAKAISDLTRKQTDLTAAQQTFVKVAQLSLFNYL